MNFAAALAAADGAALAHLGGAVRYASAYAVPIDLTGIFDAAYVRLDAGEAGVESAGPAVWLRLSDLPTDPDDDEPTITVAGIAYSVWQRQKDGAGGVLLRLHRKD